MSPLSYPCRLRRLLAAFAVVAVSLLGLGAAPATAAAPTTIARGPARSAS